MVLDAVRFGQNSGNFTDMRAVIASGDKLNLLCEYLKSRIGCTFDPANSQGFAIMSDDDVFVGGVLISNIRYHEGVAVDCEVSIASETATAWRPEPCRAVFKYIFEQLGCARCSAITRKNNTKARAFLETFKFQLEGNIRKGYDGQRDALVYGLLAEECPFLEV